MRPEPQYHPPAEGNVRNAINGHDYCTTMKPCPHLPLAQPPVYTDMVSGTPPSVSTATPWGWWPHSFQTLKLNPKLCCIMLPYQHYQWISVDNWREMWIHKCTAISGWTHYAHIKHCKVCGWGPVPSPLDTLDTVQLRNVQYTLGLCHESTCHSTSKGDILSPNREDIWQETPSIKAVYTLHMRSTEQWRIQTKQRDSQTDANIQKCYINRTPDCATS